MRYALYVCGVAIFTLILTNCAPTKNSTGTGNNAVLCSDETCIKTVCPSYKAQTASGTVCKLIGDCEMPNMPLTSQLAIPVHGSLACGPTSSEMALDSFIINTAPTLSSWISTYSNISASTTVSGCPSSDLNCKKVVTIGDKLINGSWAQSARAVSASEVSTLLETVKAETNPTADTFKTSVYPNDVKQCDYVTGDYAINNSQPWNNILLYLSYESVEDGHSTYSGAAMTSIKFKDSESGHFIAMNGYTISTSGVLYKFHDPIYGIKWYSLKQARLNQPFCASYSGSTCLQYVKVTELPSGFEDNNPSNSFTYLVETTGEEASQDYVYKVIASISGIK